MNVAALSQEPIGRTHRVDPSVAAMPYESAYFRLSVSPDCSLHQLPKTARDLVADCLRLWGIADIADDAMVVTSELVTNAVQHAFSGVVGLALRYAEGLLRIEVRDGSTACPALRGAGDDDESGRGLQLVRHLCDAWGYDQHPEGTKSTWCSLRTPALPADLR